MNPLWDSVCLFTTLGFLVFRFTRPASVGWYFNKWYPCMLRLTVLYFFLVSRNTKLYETLRCFAKFCSFCETEKNTKIQKKCFKLFHEMVKNCFVSYFRIFSIKFWTFSSIFSPFIWVSHLLFVFRVFFSSCVPFFEFHTVLTHQWQ